MIFSPLTPETPLGYATAIDLWFCFLYRVYRFNAFDHIMCCCSGARIIYLHRSIFKIDQFWVQMLPERLSAQGQAIQLSVQIYIIVLYRIYIDYWTSTVYQACGWRKIVRDSFVNRALCLCPESIFRLFIHLPHFSYQLQGRRMKYWLKEDDVVLENLL